MNNSLEKGTIVLFRDTSDSSSYFTGIISGFRNGNYDIYNISDSESLTRSRMISPSNIVQVIAIPVRKELDPRPPLPQPITYENIRRFQNGELVEVFYEGQHRYGTIISYNNQSKIYTIKLFEVHGNINDANTTIQLHDRYIERIHSNSREFVMLPPPASLQPRPTFVQPRAASEEKDLFGDEELPIGLRRSKPKTKWPYEEYSEEGRKLKQLINMGFDKENAKVALINSRFNLENAIDSFKKLEPKKEESDLTKLINMGFDKETANDALNQNNFNLNNTIEYLLSQKGSHPEPEPEPEPEPQIEDCPICFLPMDGSSPNICHNVTHCVHLKCQNDQKPEFRNICSICRGDMSTATQNNDPVYETRGGKRNKKTKRNKNKKSKRNKNKKSKRNKNKKSKRNKKSKKR